MISATGTLESQKKDLQLSINSFDNPTELTGVEAWSQLILNLIFLEPGTYPSYPEMGVGIENYQFEFMEDAVSLLMSSIINQQKIYLKDVPLVGVVVEPAEIPNTGEIILLIHLTFSTAQGSMEHSVIAVNASPKSRHFLDFEISW